MTRGNGSAYAVTVVESVRLWIGREHRDIRIEDRRGRNLRYRARKREVAIKAPVISLSHVSVKREKGEAYPFFVFETFQPISANVRERQLEPLM